MKPDARFSKMDKSFWASVRTVSQSTGYTNRRTKQVKIPTEAEVLASFEALGLDTHALKKDNRRTPLLNNLLAYFEYRATMLNRLVKPVLMDSTQAARVFNKLRRELKPECPLPYNKQKGDKKKYAYLTCIVNMLVEKHLEGLGCDYDPRELTTITYDGIPLRTLSRRVDGAFPSAVNPIAIWEIKEYYHTTTFGSRIADGVYETFLDGLELEELYDSEHKKVLHYLVVDARYTWWECGRSYLCRLIDLLNMGYADEVIFGSEVLDALPPLIKDWRKIYAKISS